MLTHPTLDQMHTLGLAGMATAYRELAEQIHGNDLSFDERLGLMLDREIALRTDKRLTNRLATAKLRFANASIEDIDFSTHRGLDRRNVLSLAQGAWLKANENLILTGQTGTGKTWIACAFGRQAARLDYSVLYVRHATALRGSRTCKARRTLPAPYRQARSRPAADPRRLGNAYAERQAAPRSARNLRGAIPAEIDADHGSTSRGRLA